MQQKRARKCKSVILEIIIATHTLSGRWLRGAETTLAFVHSGTQQRRPGRRATPSIAHAATNKLLHVRLVHNRILLDIQGVRAQLRPEQRKVLQQILVHVRLLAYHVHIHFIGRPHIWALRHCCRKHCHASAEHEPNLSLGYKVCNWNTASL